MSIVAKNSLITYIIITDIYGDGAKKMEVKQRPTRQPLIAIHLFWFSTMSNPIYIY